MPKPISKLTWDNAAIVSPMTAAKLGVSNSLGWHGGSHGETIAETVNIVVRDRRLDGVPVLILPGHADECVTVHLGYGRTRAGKVGNGTGFNAYAIRTANAPGYGVGLEIRKIGTQYPLACTQFHHSMEGRDLVRAATIEEYRKNPNFVQGEHHH